MLYAWKRSYSDPEDCPVHTATTPVVLYRPSGYKEWRGGPTGLLCVERGHSSRSVQFHIEEKVQDDLLAVLHFGRQGMSLIISLSDRLLPADGVEGDYFGYDVGVFGSLFTASAIRNTVNGPNSGCKHMERWTEQSKLSAADGKEQDYFGTSVAIYEQSVVSGSPGSDDKGSNAGAIYVYEPVDSMWTQNMKLLAADSHPENYFGSSLSMHSDRIIVGAFLDDTKGENTGAAYIFDRLDAGHGWSQTAKIEAPRELDPFSYFGFTVAVYGLETAVGTYRADQETGCVYVYEDIESQWSMASRIAPTDSMSGSQFSVGLSIELDTMAIGQYLEGTVYIFERVFENEWSQMSKLLPVGGGDDDSHFGYTLSLNGDSLLVSEVNNDYMGSNAGAVYIFKREGSTWSQQFQLVAADGNEEDYFGSSVSMHGKRVVVGAAEKGEGEPYSGGVYIYNREDVPTLTPSISTAPSGIPTSLPTSPSSHPSESPTSSFPTQVPSKSSVLPTSAPSYSPIVIPPQLTSRDQDQSGDAANKAIFTAVMVFLALVAVFVCSKVLLRMYAKRLQRRNALMMEDEEENVPVYAAAQFADSNESGIVTDVRMEPVSPGGSGATIELVAVPIRRDGVP